MPSLSHPLRSLRLSLALAVVCGLSFVGYRVRASETNGSWLIQLKNAPAAGWAAMFQANPETVSQSGVAPDSNRARSAAQGSIGLASALPVALRSRQALLPAASAPLTPVMTSCASPSFGTATNFGVGTTPYSVAIGDVNGNGKPDLAVANINSNGVSVQHHQQQLPAHNPAVRTSDPGGPQRLAEVGAVYGGRDFRRGHQCQHECGHTGECLQSRPQPTQADADDNDNVDGAGVPGGVLSACTETLVACS